MGKKGAADKPDAPRQIQNRKARYDYEILETFEAGIVLIGSEVKSIFLGRAHLADAYCKFEGSEAYLVNFDVEPYEHSSAFQHERRRERKLLLHRQEIELIARRALEKGLSVVPLRVYFKKGKAKVEIALARGRRAYDKRDKIEADEARREAQAARKEARTRPGQQ